MIKKILLLVCLLLAWKVQAQSVISVPFNDIKDRTYQWPDNLVHGRVYNLEVTDVNRNLFGVESRINQRDINVKLPALLSGFKLPGFATLSLPETKDAGLEIMEMPESGQEALREIDHQLETINDCYAYLEEVGRLGNVINNLLRDCERPYATLEEEMMRITNAVLLVDKRVGLNKSDSFGMSVWNASLPSGTPEMSLRRRCSGYRPQMSARTTPKSRQLWH